ncbi:MAG: hypothetical protein HYX86_05970 [Chloroflexi bacterium]|nr:hypothetical protein [Chloroflexota bacterium]
MLAVFSKRWVFSAIVLIFLVSLFVACQNAAGQTPLSPSEVFVSGPFGQPPLLDEDPPEGEGELGRLLLEWQDNSNNEDGFRIYLQDCSGVVQAIEDLPADTTVYGPLNACRPLRLGVAAFSAWGESEIVWALPKTGP